MKKREKLMASQIKELRSVLNNKKSSLREGRIAQAILLIDQGHNHKFITDITLIGRSQIYQLRNAYSKTGLEAIRDKRKGPPKELLKSKERKQLVAIVKEDSPRKHGYFSDFWSTAILGDLIKKMFNVHYKSKKPLYLLFEAAEYSYHLPGTVYRNRNKEAVEKWKEESQPILQEAFNEPNTVILCEDEMILTTVTTTQKVWLPKGEYPKVEVANKRERRSFYGFINLKTGNLHTYKTQKQNMYQTVEILKNIRMLYPDKKILLLWDNAGWHKGSAVVEFIKLDGNIQVHHFPPYAPELNPQEHVWKFGRSAVTHNVFIEKIDEMADKFVDFLNNSICNYHLLGFGPTL